jgi:hypothetical protein
MEHQLDATITVLLISKISSTCFGQTICCKNFSLALLKMGKSFPKHVELILEINKTVIVASSWCSVLLYLSFSIVTKLLAAHLKLIYLSGSRRKGRRDGKMRKKT